MAFRRPKSHRDQRSAEWNAWIERCRPALSSIGLAAEVYLDEGRWHDFLENGDLHWHEGSGFKFDDLSPGQLAALLRLLEQEYGSGDRTPPLLQWARVRLGQTE